MMILIVIKIQVRNKLTKTDGGKELFGPNAFLAGGSGGRAESSFLRLIKFNTNKSKMIVSVFLYFIKYYKTMHC